MLHSPLMKSQKTISLQRTKFLSRLVHACLVQVRNMVYPSVRNELLQNVAQVVDRRATNGSPVWRHFEEYQRFIPFATINKIRSALCREVVSQYCSTAAPGLKGYAIGCDARSSWTQDQDVVRASIS